MVGSLGAPQAQARGWWRGRRRRDRRLAAGALLGAAISEAHAEPAYGYGYARPAPAYGYGYAPAPRVRAYEVDEGPVYRTERVVRRYDVDPDDGYRTPVTATATAAIATGPTATAAGDRPDPAAIQNRCGALKDIAAVNLGSDWMMFIQSSMCIFMHGGSVLLTGRPPCMSRSKAALGGMFGLAALVAAGKVTSRVKAFPR